MSASESPATLEREIAGLTRKIERARAELASLRAHGPEPRGMVPGVLAGMVVVVVAFVAFAMWVGTVVLRATG